MHINSNALLRRILFSMFFIGAFMSIVPTSMISASTSVIPTIKQYSQADITARIKSFTASPPLHILGIATSSPLGLTPNDIKTIYHLPSSGGSGTIALITAYNDAQIENDLNAFNKAFNLVSCTTANGCFEKHRMSTSAPEQSGWSLEQSLDVEWSHAVAPKAKILLVEAASGSGKDLLAAIDYARNRTDVVAVSMSWGGKEFAEETSLDAHFTGKNTKIAFFASSGDSGAGVSWPAASPKVVSVGGTSFQNIPSTSTAPSVAWLIAKNFKEVAWNGSGGGVSAYEPEPDYQKVYNISRDNGMRGVPDVSYNADPIHGFAVYRSTTSKSTNNWYTIGGTSAGAPQWAAIHSLGLSAFSSNLYKDKNTANNGAYFRDITAGANGNCSYYCSARAHYDYVTGLGSPLTVSF